MFQYQILEVLRPRSEILPNNREVFYMDDEKLEFLIALCLNKKLSWKFKSDLCQRILTDFYPYKHDWKIEWDSIDVWDPSMYLGQCLSCDRRYYEFRPICDKCNDNKNFRQKTFLAFQLNQLRHTYLGAKANGFFFR